MFSVKWIAIEHNFFVMFHTVCGTCNMKIVERVEKQVHQVVYLQNVPLILCPCPTAVMQLWTWQKINYLVCFCLFFQFLFYFTTRLQTKLFNHCKAFCSHAERNRNSLSDIGSIGDLENHVDISNSATNLWTRLPSISRIVDAQDMRRKRRHFRASASLDNCKSEAVTVLILIFSTYQHNYLAYF